MAKIREEIVGKRFLSVSKSSKLKLSKISQWDWRAGVIRACTHADTKHPELQILVEYEDVSWERREWIHVHKDQAFQILLVEHTLVLAPRSCWPKLRGTSGLCPALIFNALVDDVGLSDTKERPVEYLVDKALEFHDYATLKNYQEGECVLLGGDESTEAVRRWVAEQDGQRILCTTPSVLVGFRIQVYRSEGTTQWYTAVIVGYNDATRELTVTDDTVLEEHSEDPSLVHIRLLGEGVVESILRGENVGITPRRSRSGVNNLHATGLRHNRRETVTSLRGRKSTCPSSKVPTPLTSPLLGQSPPSPARSSSPTSPRFPLINSVKQHTVIQTSSENQSPNEEKLQELGNFNRIFHPTTKTSSTPSAQPDVSVDGKGSVFFGGPVTPKEANHPPKYLSNINTLNSPSSPTNPDKPTNPRKETLKSSDSKLGVSSQVENPVKGTTKSPVLSSAAVCTTEKRKQVSSAPEVKDNQIISENRLEESKKENYSFVSSTCSVNSSLKKVIIKVKNNLQLINPPSLNEITKLKEKELPLKVSSDLNSGEKIKVRSDVFNLKDKELKVSSDLNSDEKVKDRSDVLKVKDHSNVNTVKVTDKSDSGNCQVADKNILNDKKVTGKAQLLETKIKYKSELSDTHVAGKPHSLDSKLKNSDSSDVKVTDKEKESESKLLSASEVKDSTLKLKIDISDSKIIIKNEISESKAANKENLENSEGKNKIDLSDLKFKVKSELVSLKNDSLPSDTELHLVAKTASDSNSPHLVDSGRQVDALQQLDNNLKTNNNNNDQLPSANLESKVGAEQKKECVEPAKQVISDSEVAIKNELPRDDRQQLDKERPAVRDRVDKVTVDNKSVSNSLSDVKTLFDVTPLTNGKLRPIPVLYHTSTSLPSENKPSVPDFLKVKNSNSHRQVILLSSEGLKIEETKSEESLDKKSHSLLYPSIDLVKSSTDINSLTVTPTSLVVGDLSTSNIDVASRLLNTDCTLSLSRVEDSTGFQARSPLPNDDLSIVSVTPTTVNSVEESCSNKVGSSSLSPSGLRGSIHTSYSGGELAQSLAAAGAVSGRAVTITATSGPAPQGNSRVASPPSVSITAVVRSPNTFQPLPPQAHHHNLSDSTAHHHDGVAAALHHPHPPSQPHLGPLTTSRMDQGDGSSDSGVSVTERSVSRSSVLSDDRSSSAEVKPNTPTPTSTPVSVSLKTSLPPLVIDRKEAVKVWRNPAVLSQSELAVRHIHSLQHTAMSQHFPGVPPHIGPPGGNPVVTHQVSHPSAHGSLPPPANSLAHGIPQLHYPGPHGPPPMHLTQGLQPSLTAAALYPQLQQDVWKQLGHVGPLTSHHAAYAASLLPRHQEEYSYLEHQARELEKQDRNMRERREAEVREKQIKEKMERERVERRKERERRERDERERSRRAEWGSEADLQLVNKHFEDSFRYAASQKHGRENIRQMPGETHPASVFYGQGLANQQTQATPLAHTQSLLISQQPQPLPQSQQPTHKNFQPHSQGSPWGQNLGNLALKVDHRQPPSRHPQASQPSGEGMRKVKEPEQFVKDSIYNAFRSSDDPNNDPLMKSHNPPPAHSKHSLDKSSSMSGYPVSFGLKDHKSHPMDRSSYPLPHEKASVIVQPDLKYDKVAQLSVSPKQRPPERSSPYSSSSTSGINPYKPYEPTTPNRGSTPHHPSSLSPSPHSVELTKARQPVSSPHTVPVSTHADRYYSTGNKPPISNPYQQNIASPAMVQSHLHNVNALPVKSKVSSPPLQMYGKPGITSGTPVCKMDPRPAPQPLILTSKSPSLNGPPPAHLGNRNQEARPPPTTHEHRVSHNRSPFDTRLYSSSGASHPKTVTTSVVSPHPVPRIPTTSPHVLSDRHSPHQPTQTQPLDLGTRDGGSNSPNSRRRSLTPTPQDVKRPRLENATSSPFLSRVSEPSPLYPTAATTITTVENTAAFAKLQRESSPVSSSPQSNLVTSIISKSSSIITNTPNTLTNPNSSEIEVTATSVGNPRPSSQPPPPSTTPNSVRAESNSPPSCTKQCEPEKCTSPGPAGAVGYVHKLKKAWLQRHKSGVEIPATSDSANHTDNSNDGNTNSNNNSLVRGSTPANTSCSNTSTPSTPISSTLKTDQKPIVRKPKLLPGLPNGHGQDGKEADTSSTDSEDSNSMKIKRTKTKRSLKKLKKGSESNSDSDKESDGSEGSFKKSENLPMKQDTEPRRRRGRKPKVKAEKEDVLKAKRPKEDPPNDPLQKPPVSQLKKTGESFLQDRSCYEVAPKLPKCRECRWTAQQRNKKMPNIFCRFYAFRRLRYTKNGQLAVAGFSNPVKDAFGEDLRLWVPDPNAPAPDLDCEMSKFLLTHVGDQFCDLVQQEKEAMALHMGDDPDAAWKRVVQGVREMCDVCETTLFNIHWACSKCGFVVCIDCYKGRKEGTVKVWDVEESAKERDKYSWLLCASRVPHELDKLMLTQIIAGNALVDLGKKIHESRYKWSVPMYCGCPEANKYKEKEQEDKKLNGINKDLIKNMKKESKSDLVNGTVKLEKGERINGKDDDMSNSPLNFFADVALSNDKRESETSNSDSDSDSDGKEDQPSTLRELLTVRPSSKLNVMGKEEQNNASKIKEPSKKKAKLETLDDVISCVIERGVDKDNKKDPMKVELKHFVRKYNYNRKGREPIPIRIMTRTESRLLYPNVPHSWLCDGKLLRLHDPLHKDNVTVFQDQWKRGQPVIVSGTGQSLNQDLWKPQAFSKDFGEAKNNLINCLTENIVPNQPMKKFWEGFEHYSKRLKDDKGQPMVLKLKDWPPGEDFAEMLPTRFDDLMRILPMGQYTRRNGSLNLAGRLPECFVRPDLGPKMYIAYGSASYPSKASTNLHLDISDAVNVMCYVGIPKDMDYEENTRETLKAIDEAGCDILTRQRVREKEEVPGALWHIYHARDADKIRDLLNKVAIERGKKLEPFHDPIHDQSWYLDGPLRERLYKEYAVEGYAIVQCMGDAVFIPAGAPHQVRNLQNCVKVAEDFVSPENISHCFHLTQEFRHLSDTHTNHEDKLQIKNIIYHAMKDAVATLAASEQRMEAIEVKEEGKFNS